MELRVRSEMLARQLKLFIKGIAACVSVGLAMSTQVLAHHSTSAFDLTKLVELEGEIAKVFWRNPHVMLHMSAIEEGKEVTWVLEGSSVSSQTRRGLTKDLIQVGDKIRVAGYASTREDRDMLAYHLLLPTGQELMLRGNREPYWPEASLIAYKEGIDPEKAASAEADGLYRVWTWARLEPDFWFFRDVDKFSFTQEALAKQRGWNEFTDNMQLDCTKPGMPATMGNPYPIEFIQVGDNIELRAEEFDVVRTIHMNADPDASIPYSHQGYSVGRWEDENTLVVSTANINYPYFNRVGISQSEQVTTLERFRLDEANGKLDYELTVTDPWALEEPFQLKGQWTWVPGEERSLFDCAVGG